MIGESGSPHIAAFTDTYLPTVNGVTYALKTARDEWVDRGGRVDVIYPGSEDHTPSPTEYPITSVGFPFYDGYRAGLPVNPRTLGHRLPTPDIVHIHTLYTIGFAGYRFARKANVPVVATYHTPIKEYVEYVAPNRLTEVAASAIESYEKRLLNKVDLVVTPSNDTREYLLNDVGVSTRINVVRNGVNTSFFQPIDEGDFRTEYDLPCDELLVGYTGRHGHEKTLGHIIKAADRMNNDVTVVFGGDGPAREDLETLAARSSVDVRFLGFLDRTDLPRFYSALDVFAFPSRVETEGLVAVESMACGTPVVAANQGALKTTVSDRENGLLYEWGNSDDFASQLDVAINRQSELQGGCLNMRDQWGVSDTVDEMEDIYQGLVSMSSGSWG